MPKKLSANMLYNYVKCPHRFTLDLFGDYSKQKPSYPYLFYDIY